MSSCIVKFGQNSPDYDTYTFSQDRWETTNCPNDTWVGTAPITPQMLSGDYHIRVVAQGEDGSQLDKDENLASYEPGPDILHHAVGVSIPFGVELQKVRFAKIDRAINNRQTVENLYVS